MISESLFFTFNNVDSRNYNVSNVHVNSGMYEEYFLPNTEIKETLVRRHKIPYIFEIRRHPLEFDLILSIEKWDNELLGEISRWLYVDYYVPLVFSASPEKIYYCLPSGEPKITHNGNNQGYITIHMRCNSPYSYGSVITSQTYDFTTNPAQGTTITFMNQGDLPINPVIYATIVSGSGFTITNTTNTTIQPLAFTGLTIGETITIDCFHEDIFTSLANTYRFNNMTGDFLEMLRGNNQLLIVGNIKLYFQYEYILLQS